MRILLIAETNWVVDIVLQQNITTAYLLSLSDNPDIDIFVPEFSFYEADGTIRGKLNNQVSELEHISGILNKISQTQKYLNFCNEVKKGIKGVREDISNDLKIFRAKLDEVRKLIDVLPYSKDILIKARLRHVSSKPPFKLSDCEIYESVLDFLGERGRDYDKLIFYTADKEDFDHEEIHHGLKELNCELYFSSGEVVERVRVG